MNRETLISIINKNGIRFLPVRRCSLCNEGGKWHVSHKE